MSLFPSLQSRLLAGLITGTTLLLAANGAAIWIAAERSLTAKLDESLLETMRSNLAEITGQLRESQRPNRGPGRPFPGPRERVELTFQCWNVKGEPSLKSEHLGENDLPALARGMPTTTLEELDLKRVRFESIALPDGTAGRAAAVCFLPPRPERREHRGNPRQPLDGFERDGGPPPDRPGGFEGDGGPPPAFLGMSPYELVVAREQTSVESMLSRLAWLLLVAWASSSAGSALILAFLVRRGLRPLEHLRDQVYEVDAGELDRRFHVPDAPTELQPVVEELNGLLERVRRAFERERGFNADVAHELRTPLAGLRTTLEVFLDRDREPAEGRETADRCLAITLEMQGVVEVLLEMAALDAGGAEERREELGIDEQVLEVAEHLTVEHAGETPLVERHIDLDLRVRTDPVLLRRILANLLENARLYGDPGARIVVRGCIDEEGVRIVVENALAYPPPELAERCFEAFWRADPSRRDTGRHAGLGLPLCRKIARRLGGALEAKVQGDRFAVTLTLPSRVITG